MLVKQEFVGNQKEDDIDLIGILTHTAEEDDGINALVLSYIDSNDDSLGVPLNAGFAHHLQ